MEPILSLAILSAAYQRYPNKWKHKQAFFSHQKLKYSQHSYSGPLVLL